MDYTKNDSEVTLEHLILIFLLVQPPSCCMLTHLLTWYYHPQNALNMFDFVIISVCLRVQLHLLTELISLYMAITLCVS